MRKGDYSTVNKALSYNQRRFAAGLGQVASDEAKIIDDWLGRFAPKNGVYLDLGTGTGRAIGEILKFYPSKIFAVDESSYMLEVMKNNYLADYKSGKVKSIKSKIEELKMQDNSIDIVTSLHVVKHIKNTQKVFDRVSKVLKKDGYFIFDTLNINSIVRFNLDTCYAPGFDSVEEQLKSAGFKIIETRQLHILGETIYRLLWPFSATFSRLDSILTRIFPFGSKIFILAQKQ